MFIYKNVFRGCSGNPISNLEVRRCCKPLHHSEHLNISHVNQLRGWIWAVFKRNNVFNKITIISFKLHNPLTNFNDFGTTIYTNRERMCYSVWYILLGRVEGEVSRSNKVRTSLTEFDRTADNETQKCTKNQSARLKTMYSCCLSLDALTEPFCLPFHSATKNVLLVWQKLVPSHQRLREPRSLCVNWIRGYCVQSSELLSSFFNFLCSNTW